MLKKVLPVLILAVGASGAANAAAHLTVNHQSVSKDAAPAAAPEIDPQVLEKINKDMAKLD